MTGADLEKLLAEVTPGEWMASRNGVRTYDKNAWATDGMAFVCKSTLANARLLAASKTLARRVIAAEKLAEALRSIQLLRQLKGFSDRFQLEEIDLDVSEALAAWDAAE